MAASLLGDSPSTLKLIPRLRDIFTFNEVIRQTGTEVTFNEDENILRIDPAGLDSTYAPYELVRRIRAHSLIWVDWTGGKGKAKPPWRGAAAGAPVPCDLL